MFYHRIYSYFVYSLLISICLSNFFDEKEEEEQQQQRKLIKVTNRKSQKDAMVMWSKSLTENDYDNTYWPKIAGERSGPPQYFDLYIQKLSSIFQQNRANVNFISIGACDGTNDLTIKRYLKFSHWHGMFIEPVSINYDALVKFLADNQVTDRSFALRAAATDICKLPTIKLQRPLYEEKGNAEGKGRQLFLFYFILFYLFYLIYLYIFNHNTYYMYISTIPYNQRYLIGYDVR